MHTFHTIERPMKVYKCMGQSTALSIDQASVQECQLCRGEQVDRSRNIKTDEHGIPIYKTIVQIVRTGVQRYIIAHSYWQNLDVRRSLKVTLPKCGTSTYMVVMITPDQEGLVV